MKPEKQNLIHDLLDDGRSIRRDATFLASGHILRRRRWRRRAWQSCAVTAMLGMTALVFQQMTVRRTITPTIAFRPAEADGSLTDAELLALFPNTPVGLATLENGKKRLIFPRPGDEQRFISHL